MESVLVIGGCGALGHRLVSELLQLDSPPHHVYVFDVRTENNRIDTVEYCNVDITSKDQVKTTLKKLSPLPEVIIHTASPPPGLLDLELYIKVNVEGTRNLLECAEVCTKFCRTRRVGCPMTNTILASHISKCLIPSGKAVTREC